MQTLLLFTALFTGLSTILALWSVFVAREARQMRAAPTKRLTDCELRLADLEDRQTATHDLVKKLNARTAMRIARETKQAQSDDDSVTLDQAPGESPAEWKARVRRELAAKRLR